MAAVDEGRLRGDRPARLRLAAVEEGADHGAAEQNRVLPRGVAHGALPAGAALGAQRRRATSTACQASRLLPVMYPTVKATATVTTVKNIVLLSSMAPPSHRRRRGQFRWRPRSHAAPASVV